MSNRIVCECGIDCGPNLRDELVTLRAEARRALWWIDQATQGETWRNWDDVMNARGILRALFPKK